MGNIRGLLLLFLLSVYVSTGLANADENITNCTEVTAASPDDIDSTPGNANFAQDPSLFEDDESCVAVRKVIPYDYGDAPDPTFPTTEANNGAKHLLGSDVYLGTCVDNDSGSLHGDATADDQHDGEYDFGACNGTDDEDGVVIPDMQIAQTGVQLTVTANQACLLNAWIDWNVDGDWNDSNEQIASDLSLTAGANAITLDVPTTARVGNAYARFRCSSAGGDDITGEAADGEIEDYRVALSLPNAGLVLKKYVQAADNAPAYDQADEAATLGDDAQSSIDAVNIDYNANALYRIRVENTGATWLMDVQIDEQIDACTPLTKIYDSNAASLDDNDGTTNDGVLAPGEVHVYECQLSNVTDDIANVAVATGTPAYPPETPSDPPVATDEPPLESEDPAHVRSRGVPNIELKKYVQAETGAAVFDINTSSTYGMDAQDDDSAVAILYNGGALYTIIVENTGDVYLSDVTLDDQIDACDPLTQVYDSDASTDTRAENVMAPGEIWAFQCTLATIQDDVTNIAQVRATPVNPPPADPNDPLVPTGQTPPSDVDSAVITTTSSPAIALKKYVMPAPTATATPLIEGDVSTYGSDAQDDATAVNITYPESATYRIRIQNTGTTWLDNVVVDDRIESCAPLTKVYDSDTNTPDGVMSVGEIWWYECTLPGVESDLTNIAVVEGRPVHIPDDPTNPPADLTPTGQSPVDDDDPANITTTTEPAIVIKKYVQAATGAASFDELDSSTWGADAQDSASAVNITYTEDALYRIMVQNVGSTWLSNVVVDEQIEDCSLSTIVGTTDASDGFMDPNEIWWFECRLNNITAPVTNIATVEGVPSHANQAPTGQSPVNDTDPANITTTSDPRIELKKYVQDGATANAWNPADLSTLGADAQDSQNAIAITYGGTAVYRITVTNTGATWLDRVVMDDLIEGCATTLIDNGDADANNYLAPNERWVYECSLANVTDEALTNTAIVEARPINENGEPTGQSPVNSSDPAHIMTGSHSIGNMVWIDDGAGNPAYANNGLLDANEQAVANGVSLSLLDASGTVLQTTVTSDGYYLFHHLTAGSYQVCVDADNFATTGLLSTYIASSGGNEIDPNADVDSNDNGDDNVSDGMCSDLLILADDEPQAETPTASGNAGDDGQATADHQSNLTVDFAVIPTYSLGNQIWIDDGAGELANANNGQWDAGEMAVPDTVILELLDDTGAVIDTTSPNSGYYLFSGLNAGDYAVRIAATNFADSAELGDYLSCSQGNEADPNLNIDGNDNGLDVDPLINGISTGLVSLGDGEPLLESPTASGVDGNDGANRADSYTNLTVDLCVVKLTGIGNRIWLDESDPAARDANDIDNSVYDNNESPLSNVIVQLFAEGTDPSMSDPYRTTQTDAEGCYHFDNLPESRYFVHLPAEQFSSDQPLDGLISSTGAGADDGSDDNVDENGLDVADPSTSGLNSIVYNLTAGAEGTAERACGRYTSLVADDSIDDTADFGLIRSEPLGVPRIELKKYVQTDNGAPAYDATNDATLGMDAQTDDVAVPILYGETALYRMTVTNIGDVHLANINLDDEIDNCDLQRIDPQDDRIVLAPSERWVYECRLTNIQDDVTNIAKVNGTPIEPPVDSTDPNAVIIPTGQTPPTDVDPAVITTEFGPAIHLKKYVTDATTAPLLVEGDLSSYGSDAQDDREALNITYGNDALYRIRVQNTGTTWLENVVVDDRIEACDPLTKVSDSDANTPDGVMSVGEIWWLECTLPAIIEPVTNIATVEGLPVHIPEDPANPPVDLTPTGQSPVDDDDLANVTTYVGPAIIIKKYVQAANGASSFDANDDATWGADAQDDASAVNITYTEDALYRIRVQNVGETWLNEVVVDEQIDACALNTIGETDPSDGFMSPNEIWWFECTLSNIVAPVTNIATVEGVPTHENATPTGQSRVNDTDPANISTTSDPRIALKKYVQDGATANAWNPADLSTLGNDAQDEQQAIAIPYDGTALYRITVTNTGATWLDSVVMDDLLDDCVATRIDNGDGDANDYLAPNERWVYECSLSNVTNESLTNTAVVEARPINEDGSSRDQSPVDSSDPAHIVTGAHSLGNMVWIDDGNGNAAYANNGLIDNNEQPAPNGVELILLDDNDIELQTTVTTDGYYLFHHLPAGNYQVCISLDNFTTNGVLAAYAPSTGGNEIDPNADIDGNDNGDDTVIDGICSGMITLDDGEPTQETPTDNGAAGVDGQGTVDHQSNLTIDFGLIPSYSLGNQIWIDDGAGTLAHANNGQWDDGELPVPDTVELELLDSQGNVLSQTNPVDGFYLFAGLQSGDYRVRIAANNFAADADLAHFQSCSRGNEADPNANGDGNDNGIDTDPRAEGISTGIVTLGDNEPLLEQPTVDGIPGSDVSNRPDSYTNLTVDLCVVKLTGIGNRIWLDESNPENRIQSDINNGIYDIGETTVGNAVVEVFPEGADPSIDAPYAVTITDIEGCYHVNDLPEGNYFVHLPFDQFVTAGPLVNSLSGYLSSTGVGSDDGIDDNADENGQDTLTPESVGIMGTLHQLQAGAESTGERVCGTNTTYLIDESIDDSVDFGLLRYMSLGDQIWIDRNADGVQDPEESPLQGATVTVFNADGSQAQNAMGELVEPVVSDIDGLYLFNNLMPGDYYIEVLPPEGYLPTPIYSHDPDLNINTDSDCINVWGESRTQTGIVTLLPGEEPLEDGDYLNPNSNLTLDCGFYEPVSVGNYVWVDRDGDGVQGIEEKALANAIVEITDVDGAAITDAANQAVSAQTTVDDGIYLFDYLIPGDYLIKVTPPDEEYLPTRPATDPDDDINTDNNGKSDYGTHQVHTDKVTLWTDMEPIDDGDSSNDSNLSVDFGFVKPMAVGRDVWLDQNADAYYDDDELPIIGHTLSLLYANGTPANDIDGKPVESVTTDQYGHYEFTHLWPGDYIVITSVPAEHILTDGGLDPDNDDNRDSNGHLDNDIVSSLPVTLWVNEEPPYEAVEDGDQDINTNWSVDFGFYRAVSVGNVIWHDVNANGIQDEGEPGISGAVVTLTDSNGNPVVDINGDPVQPITTDETGVYHFGELKPGEYIVTVELPEDYYVTVYGGDPNSVTNPHDSNCQVDDNGTIASPVIVLHTQREPDEGVDNDDYDGDLTVGCGFYRPAAVGNIIWEDLNGNGIQNTNEPGLSNMTVTLHYDDWSEVMNVHGEPVLPVQTGSDGLYVFDELIPGHYIVKVQAPQSGYHVTVGGENPDQNQSDADSNCAVTDDGVHTPVFSLVNDAEPATELDGDDRDRDMTVDCGFIRPVSVGDYVWVDADRNGLQDTDEKPLAGAIVTLLDADGNRAKDLYGELVAQQQTADDGKYLFDNLLNGDYIIHVETPAGYKPSIGGEDPDNDNNLDNNGLADVGNASGMSLPVTLIWGEEPVNDGDNDPATNLTVDFGFIPTGVHIPTLSEWAMLLMSLLIVGIAYRRYGRTHFRA